MKLVAYVRTSTSKQDIGLEVQAKAINAYCDTYSHEIVSQQVEQKSASSMEGRTKLLESLELVKSGIVDGIIVYKLDRLTRSVRDLGDILDAVGKRSIVSVMDHMDTSTANGRMVLNILTSIAQWEREAISERTKSALDALRADGKVSGAVPYGKMRNGDYLIDNAAEIAVIERVRELKKLFPRISLRELAECLYDEGMTNRRGVKFHPEEVKRIANG